MAAEVSSIRNRQNDPAMLSGRPTGSCGTTASFANTCGRCGTRTGTRPPSPAATSAEWLEDPERPAKLLNGEPVLSRTVELHASKGTCTYRCQMCLWSDQEQLTYIRRSLDSGGLLTTDEWCTVVDQLADHGVRTVVLSGGGEVLLNRDLPAILTHIRQRGLTAHLYTTGYHLPRGADHPLWREVAQLDQVRFSIHAPDPATYDAITQLPPRLQAPGMLHS